jgi:hypothetical protein
VLSQSLINQLLQANDHFCNKAFTFKSRLRLEEGQSQTDAAAISRREEKEKRQGFQNESVSVVIFLINLTTFLSKWSVLGGVWALQCQQWRFEHFLEEAKGKTETMNHFLGKFTIPVHHVSMFKDDFGVAIASTWKF